MTDLSVTATLTCMEVWGGNAVVDSGVVMAGLDAWVYCKPFASAESGGDVYYVSSCATGRITRLLVADVSGHGTHVANIAISLRTLMRKHVNQIDQTRFVQSMNQQFTEMSDAGCFATAIVTTFFAPTHELSICNAGHPPPMLYRASKKKWSVLVNRGSAEEASNVPLGIIDIADYDQFDVRLKVGDLVLCYTDSLMESKDENGHMLGVAGLLKIVQELDVSKPDAIVLQLLTRISTIFAGNLGEDDVTVLLFRPNGLSPQAPLGQRLLAPLRVVGSIASRIAGSGEPIPWPEFNLRNIGGTMSSRLEPTRS